MGVKSLSTFLRYNADEIGRVAEIAPLSGNTPAMTQRQKIVVDSHGFLITFATEVMHRNAAHAMALDEEHFPYATLAGGDLQCIRSAMVFMITRLRYVFGVEFVFAVDAPVGIAQHDAINRGAVVAKRGAKRDARLVEQLETCAKNGTTNAAEDALLRQNNRPQMLVEQLYETLFQLNVTVKHLDDEVDRYIGALVHDYDPICVFTGDSDFVVTPGIPVVMDFDYPWDVMLHGWDASVRYSTMANDALRNCIVDASRAEDEPLCLFLLESARLASFLNLSQDELLLAMSLCGNEITEEVMKKIGLAIPRTSVKNNRPTTTNCHGRGFHSYVLHAAALAKEIVKHSIAPDDETQGLLSQLRFGVNVQTLCHPQRFLKKLLNKVIAAPLDPAARLIDTSSHEWKQILDIFGPELFTNWFLSHLHGEEIDVPGKGRQIMIWKDLPPVDVPVAQAKKKNKKAAETNGTVDCDDKLVADLKLSCKAVVHALSALTSMNADLIAILQSAKCADDGTDHQSSSEKDSFLKSLAPVVPFKILQSIQQYKLSSQQTGYEPLQFSQSQEECVLYEKLTSQRLPSSFLLIVRSGRCNDHAIPVISGRFGFSLDLFTFYRLRQVIAHRLGRDTIRVRNHSGDVIKPYEPKLSDAWPTAATASVVPTDDIGSDQTSRQTNVPQGRHRSSCQRHRRSSHGRNRHNDL